MRIILGHVRPRRKLCVFGSRRLVKIYLTLLFPRHLKLISSPNVSIWLSSFSNSVLPIEKGSIWYDRFKSVVIARWNDLIREIPRIYSVSSFIHSRGDHPLNIAHLSPSEPKEKKTGDERIKEKHKKTRKGDLYLFHNEQNTPRCGKTRMTQGVHNIYK